MSTSVETQSALQGILTAVSGDRLCAYRVSENRYAVIMNEKRQLTFDKDIVCLYRHINYILREAAHVFGINVQGRTIELVGQTK